MTDTMRVPVALERRDDLAARMVCTWELGCAVQTWNARLTPTGIGANGTTREREASEVYGRQVWPAS